MKLTQKLLKDMLDVATFARIELEEFSVKPREAYGKTFESACRVEKYAQQQLDKRFEKKQRKET